ncbi:DNA polymerase-3 subunit delta [Parabacteroides sp. PH5-13]|uniref:DNA polymerase III subunit delta n=1 Tax=unclassified Parabacteroides TaxID=2649774 RepID=UPI002475A282|nr:MULTISPECIES: DNA polymerase III subunit delta [unclassified Parabacteroides]MDH6303806.1 DNA polymerase-3 subunit delta [Parabacteroides sp. PH5-39]MDH6318512.1 DNA polymerase-3 subunit delta [Parabacteroides sp. PH5-13]MDH6322195.1 DNA polymerase-3 subunit delta [Parabacteroides sp. PH5-8]MDH6383353.1 DNA polymerase-3 subunit delta [Parabacteroides sp. PH5-17]MDH6392686.1 DNA polymerase-3 subunit delta [Parabacteroides sp. PFB2-22]
MAKKEYTFDEIAQDIRARKFQPIYCFMGEEPYFIDKLTELLIETVLNESERDFNQTILYGADTDAVQVLNAARRFPMMSEYQLVVVREAQLIRNIELLSNYATNPLKSTVLVINYKYKALDRRKSLANAIDKNGILFTSNKIKDYKMPAFIVTFLQQRSTTIDPKAAQMLSDFLGNDLSRLSKELDKLAILMPENAPKRITPELVEQNIGISKEYNNFELLNAITSKDILKANRIAQYFEKNPKNNPLTMTLPVLFNYFSNLLICHYAKDRSERGIMSALDLYNAYQTKDYIAGLKNYSAMKTFNLISDIRNTDAQAKGVDNNSTPDGELLKELLYRILH